MDTHHLGELLAAVRDTGEIVILAGEGEPIVLLPWKRYQAFRNPVGAVFKEEEHPPFLPPEPTPVPPVGEERFYL